MVHVSLPKLLVYLPTHHLPPLIPTDVDSSSLSSALIFIQSPTSDETLHILNVTDEFITTTPLQGQLTITARSGMASITAFEEILQRVVYSTTRQT